MLKGKRIFLTGGAGFIGATLIGQLIEDNKVWVFDSFARDSLSSRPFAAHPNLTIIRGDVLDAARVRDAILGSDPNLIIHLAAIAGIETVLKSPTSTMRVNMVGTVNTIAAANELKHLERFVEFSTSEVFGGAAFRVDEEQQAMIGAVGEARWIYAVSKLAGEHLVHAYHREFGMPTVTLTWEALVVWPSLTVSCRI